MPFAASTAKHTTFSSTIAVAGLIQVLVFVGTVSGADDWPSWRGPFLNGKARSTDDRHLPVAWSETRNIIWKSTVPGRGHSSPVVYAGRIYLTSADEQEETQFALCYDSAQGDLLWKQELNRGGFMPLHAQNSHASPTVAANGEQIFVVLYSHTALDVSALTLNGDIAWKKRIGPYSLAPQNEGYGSSPVVYKDRMIVNGDNRLSGFLAALDARTGALLWRQSRVNEGSFCSPVVAELAGRSQLLVSGIRTIDSYDPMTGDLLWRCNGTAAATANSIAFSDDGTSYVLASGGAPEKEMVCVRADGMGDVSTSHVVWRKSTSVAYVPSPVYHDGCFFVLTDTGIIQCIDAETGVVLWKNRLPGKFKASLVLAGELLYAVNEAGETYVLAPHRRYTLLSTSRLAEGAYATPALCDGRVYLRTYRNLYAIGNFKSTE